MTLFAKYQAKPPPPHLIRSALYSYNMRLHPKKRPILHFGLQNHVKVWRGTLFQNGQNQRLNWIFLHLLTFEFAQKVDFFAKIELFKV